MKRKGSFLKKTCSMMLALAMIVSGTQVVPGTGRMAKAASGEIEIATADDLAKIGTRADYPMSGDYVLTNDIDLSGRNWTPIGGTSALDYTVTEDTNGNKVKVFNGTFDGRGHVIEGLRITYDGSTSEDKANFSGLFALVASNSSADYAEIKNLNFTDVQIVHTLGRGDSIGTLAGVVNGYVKINNVAVLGGSIEVKGANNWNSELLGMGGLVGQVRSGHSSAELTNLYNAASVTAAESVSTSWARCGGILGRIHQSESIGMLRSCLNTGSVTYRGNRGYAINGNSSEENAPSNRTNVTKCYYLQGTGNDFGASTSITSAQLGTQAIADALGSDYWELSGGRVMPSVSKGKVTIPIPGPVFAEGDNESEVTKNFTLPLSYTTDTGAETISWTSSNPDVVAISGAQAEVKGVLKDTTVTLTATTSSGKTKSVIITVRSNLKIKLDQEYAKPGTALTASVPDAPAGTTFTYQWLPENGAAVQGASYTPTQNDLNTFLTVVASLDGERVDELRMYCSKLPVVYIDTDDGGGITSKTVYKGAKMRVQGNDRYNQTNTTLYDNAISIRGRGNSTWSGGQNKRPYKIKLDKKTDLFGFGKSKHWALLANYMDESLLRNMTSYDLSGKMGMRYLPSAHVELILNGTYCGNYQLVGNVRIEKSRVDIFDWEDLAGDAADAIGAAEGMDKNAIKALEDYLNENMGWITSGVIEYPMNGKTYRVEDYPQIEIPKKADGTIDLMGGYLFELDEYYDEVSKFRTNADQPVMFKSPEFITTNKTMFSAAQGYIQAVEDSIKSSDFYTTYDGERKHYTDLVDIDSLVRYFVLNEYYWNTETMKKSTFMYKKHGEKLVIGPVWDMDWTSNSLVSQSQTGRPTVWMTTTAGENAQKQQWYRSLIADPYFVMKAYECYHQNRENFEEIVKEKGIIDEYQEYLAESADANLRFGYVQHHSDFNTESERLRTFLNNRLNWMDQQFTSVDQLLNSLGAYYSAGGISVSVNTSNETSTVYTANVTNGSVAKVGFYVNGVLAGTANVSGGKAEYTGNNAALTAEKGANNMVQVRGMDASGNLLSGGRITAYKMFNKELPTAALSGTVTISGSARVGAVLTAAAETNNSGNLSYQWLADGAEIAGANAATYKLTQNETGKKIQVRVTSSVETGSLVSAETEAVIYVEVKNDHIIINQVYGGGANTDTPFSHSFIELYNPTDQTLSLDGCSIGYFSGGKNGATEKEVRVALSGSMASHTSYLIRCEAQTTAAPFLVAELKTADMDLDQTIDNKRFRVVLYRGEAVEDGVSVNEEAIEGEALPDKSVSKQKAVRRKEFADTNDNQADFETIVYEKAGQETEIATILATNRPRSQENGAWTGGTWNPDPETPETPEKTELAGTVSIRGNAIIGAVLYADEATNNSGTLSYHWYADGKEIAGADSAFYVIDEANAGKTISLSIESTAETGKLTCQMASQVKAVQPQREHLIINQVYGGGQTSKGGAALSHSFIELYNPTEQTVSLTGYSIDYVSGKKAATLELSGEIPAASSYLIQCAEEQNPKLVYTLKNADLTWDQVIDNKKYSVVLKQGETQIDGVSVNEAEVEGTPLLNPEGDEIISKNKAIRRIRFIDTDQNAEDFEVLNYSKLPAGIMNDMVPRGTADGRWGEAFLTGSALPPISGEDCTVTFEYGGQKETVKVKVGETVTPIQIPTKTDAVFEGWYLNGQKFDFSTKITDSITLVAKWRADGPTAGPAVTKVKSVINKKASRVRVSIAAVPGASSYEVYRKKGNKEVLAGTTTSTTFYDTKPVAGVSSYYVRAVIGASKTGYGAAKSITLPASVKKVTVKAVKGKKAVTVKWKRVKKATGYMVFRSTKKDSGYKRIAVIKKSKILSYTDKKVKKGKKYYYQIVTVKKKTYSPAKTSKVVKVK